MPQADSSARASFISRMEKTSARQNIIFLLASGAVSSNSYIRRNFVPSSNWSLSNSIWTTLVWMIRKCRGPRWGNFKAWRCGTFRPPFPPPDGCSSKQPMPSGLLGEGNPQVSRTQAPIPGLSYHLPQQGPELSNRPRSQRGERKPGMGTGPRLFASLGKITSPAPGSEADEGG